MKTKKSEGHVTPTVVDARNQYSPSTIEYKGKRLHLSEPASASYGTRDDLVGRDEILAFIRNAWLVRPGKLPRSPLLFGIPGVGKNHIVYEAARCTGKPLYIMNGHEDISPDKLTCGFFTESPQRKIEYVLTPLASAMLTGGICFFDEISELLPGTMNLLVSLLDERRYIDSQPLANTRLEASPEFRFIAAANTRDIDTGNFTEKVWSRLDPIRVGPGDREQIDHIIRQKYTANTKDGSGVIRRFWELWYELSTELPTPRQAQQVFSFAADLADAENRPCDNSGWTLEAASAFPLTEPHIEQAVRHFFDGQR